MAEADAVGDREIDSRAMPSNSPLSAEPDELPTLDADMRFEPSSTPPNADESDKSSSRLLDRVDFNQMLATKLPRKPTERQPARTRVSWSVVNSIAWIIWIFIVAKLFIGDVDRWIVESIAPQVSWILDYRGLFVFVAIAAILMLTRIRLVAWVMLYIVFFPLVLIFYRIPRRLYKIRSWNVALGSLHATLATVRSLRSVIALIAAVLIAVFVLRIASDTFWLALSLVTFGAVWLIIIGRAIRYSLTTNRFLKSQEALLQKFLHSSVVWSAVAVNDAQRESDKGRPLGQQASTQVIQQIGIGVLLYRGVYFWADRLDKYRKSSASMAFGCAAIIALFVEAVLLFSLMNLSVYKIDPGQFVTDGKPSLVLVVYYSVASFFASEISTMTPVGGLAMIVRILAIISVAVIALVLVVTLTLGFKQSRDAESASDTLKNIRSQAETFGSRIEKEYEEPITGLMRRIKQAGWDLLGLLTFFSSVLGAEGTDEELGPGHRPQDS